MTGFWHSELGPVTGNLDDIYGKKKNFEDIPDGTAAIAKIISFKNADDYLGKPILKIQWKITSEDFRNRVIFQNLKVFDAKPETRRRALNIFMLLYRMFDMNPASDEAPTDRELMAFENKHAGIKIGLFVNEEKATSSNFVSEVHPEQDFVCEVGLESVRAPAKTSHVDSAFSRNKKDCAEFDDSDIPF